MKITIALLVSIFCLQIGFSQTYSTKSGSINFEASVPAFEPVAAKNNSASAILKSDGTFACLALVKGFRFKVALMEEHFNENYIESSIYPKTTFKGNLLSFDCNQLTSTSQTFIAKGILNLHGIDKEIEVPVKVNQIDGKINLNSEFILKPKDFNIKIPKVVEKKISEDIIVQLDLTLE